MTKIDMIYRILFLLMLLIGFSIAQSIEECMDCHSDEDLTKYIDDSTEISLYVDLEEYHNSIHGDLECIDCHSSIDDVEHESDLPHVSCANCHDDAQEEYAESIHATTILNENIIPATCKDCHGTHSIYASDNEKSMTHKFNIEKTCGYCHMKPEVIKLLGMRGEGPVAAYHNSIHNRILRQDPGKGAPTCIDCHGSHRVFYMSDIRSSFNKLNRPETCGKCHKQAKEQYYKSIHWWAVKRGHFESPVCNDCHGEHRIESPKETDAITNRLNLSSQVCANCHSSRAMMARFGLDAERFSTYMRTYHGLAVLKGSPEAANCTSCHEIHAIRSHDNSESSIHPGNLEKTCGKCHDDISAEFIGIAAHPKDMQSRNPTAYYFQIAYIFLIVVTVGGMFIHNLIILIYYIKLKRQKIKYDQPVQRFQPFEVYQHMILIISFFMLVATGFALKYPDALWVKWLVSLGMSEEIRSLVHRIAAIVLVTISVIQLVYFIFHKKGRQEIGLLRPRIDDITDFWANMKFHLGIFKQKPKFGRWDYTEKAEYLALIWGTVIMAATGFILWFPELFMKLLPFWTFEVSEIVHFYEAWLATLSIFVWHWFLVIYHPEKYPMSLTWLDGKITEEEMKHHHPLEYEKLKQESETMIEKEEVKV